MGWFIGILIMVVVGLGCYACCVVAGRVDDATEREMNKNK